MMKQYLQIKEQNQDAILFFRLGDFYEMFGDDARKASKELDLTLTTRDKDKNKPFEEKELTFTEIDVKKLAYERHKNTSFEPVTDVTFVKFNQEIRKTEITRQIDKAPFVPSDKAALSSRAEAILRIQSYGLKKRLEHTRAKTAVIGVSGGLDSTLALLVAVRAMKLLNRPLSDICAVTMPGFGTTERTHSNSEKLCSLLGVTFKEVNITAAVEQHFKDIGQDLSLIHI